MILIASLLVGGASPVLADSISDAISAVASVNRAKRAEARQTLIKAGPAALPQILAAETNHKRLAILAVVAGMGKPAVPKLVALLDNPDLRAAAGDALEQVITPESQAQAPALVRCLQVPETKHFCGQSLARVADARTQAQVPALARLIKSPDRDVRRYAIAALTQIGAGAQTALPAIRTALKDPDPQVKAEAGIALKRISKTGVRKVKA
jgi:HEAT repeat protein